MTPDFFQLLSEPKRVTIQYFHYASAPYGCDLSALVSSVEQDWLRPEIGRIADWAQTAETLVDQRERRIRGKAVLLTGEAR
ncbi:hypothetical protein [Streptomyces cucumeris]|uniref:hypothetical protein n=1 Tax=Streptomyces cucumeris TaxID=2962890 RepID=UPI003D703E36